MGLNIQRRETRVRESGFAGFLRERRHRLSLAAEHNLSQIAESRSTQLSETSTYQHGETDRYEVDAKIL